MEKPTKLGFRMRAAALLMAALAISMAVCARAAPLADDPDADYQAWLKAIQNGEKQVYDFSQNPGLDADGDTELFAGGSGAGAEPKAPPTLKTFITVALDGSGDFRSVQAAVDAVPKGNTRPVTIFVKPGSYKEKVIIPSSTPFITLRGEDARSTEIVWGDTASSKSGGKVLSTFGSATFAVNSDNFVAAGISFRNSAPLQAPGAVGQQAVALRLSGDKAALYNVSIVGGQDTLYDHKGRHYFYNSYIEGSIDFIFGDGRSLYRKCHLHSVAKTFGSLTAQKRLDPTDAGGFSFVGCVVTGSGSLYLGRAWGPYSRVVYIYTFIADIITPTGWNDWDTPGRDKTVFYGEYETFGPGAGTASWPKWARRLTRAQAAPFIGFGYIDADEWLPSRT